MRALYLETVSVAAADLAADANKPVKIYDLKQGERLIGVSEKRLDMDGNLFVQLFIEK